MRKFVVDIDDGARVFILNLNVNQSEDSLDKAYGVVDKYLKQLDNLEYTYFNIIDVTDVDSVFLSN